MEETKKKFEFKPFIKKYGFYIGIALIMTITLIVLFSNKEVSYSGDVKYEEPVYYITGNNLYIKERGKDEVLISTSMFQDPDSRTKEEALSSVLISKDGQYLYFFENTVFDERGSALGDFCVYYKGRKTLIEEDTGIYFAISDDNSTVAYIKPNFGVQGGTGYDNIRYDLYTFSVKDGKDLVEGSVEPLWFNISGDGKSVIYTKYYDAATDTTSLFINKDGQSSFVDDHMFFYGDYVPKGTFRQNWPKTNFDGSKIVYGKRLKYGEMVDMYLYSNGENNLLGEDVLQVFTDEKLDKVLMVHNYDNEVFSGDMSRINLNTLAREEIASDVWGLATVEVALTADTEFLDMNLYFKYYDEVINVADLCLMTEEGEEVLINATDVTNIQASDDYSLIYGLEYYVPEEGGQLTKINFDDGEYAKVEFDEYVEEYTISTTGKYLVYLLQDDLFFVGPNDKKVHVDKYNVETFGVLEGDEQLYFFKESGLGRGNAYIRGLSANDQIQIVAEETHYCWDFGDGSLAFLTGYDFETSTGDMYITDGDGGYELIVQNVELPLFFNYIQ